MSKRLEPFKVPIDGRTVNMCRHKVKRPRIVTFHQEGRDLIATLSCGHKTVYCRVPKWTRCYKCRVETISWKEPVKGFKELPFITERPQ